MGKRRFAYIVSCEGHEDEFCKGYINKSIYAAEKLFCAVKAWVGATLYDAQLYEIGVLIYVRSAAEEPEKAWDKIYRLCGKFEVNVIACADIKKPEVIRAGFTVFDGSLFDLVCAVKKSTEVIAFCPPPQSALLISDMVSYDIIANLAKRLNSIYLIGEKPALLDALAQKLYTDCGTAVHVAVSKALISRCKRAYCFDKFSEEKAGEALSSVEVIRLYKRSDIRLKVLSDAYGEMALLPSAFEALYFIKSGKAAQETPFDFFEWAMSHYNY